MAFGAEITKEKLLLHLILNSYWEPLDFQLPSLAKESGEPWCRWIDTALESPHDIVEWQRAPAITGTIYRVEPRSVVVLFARLEKGRSRTDENL